MTLEKKKFLKSETIDLDVWMTNVKYQNLNKRKN